MISTTTIDRSNVSSEQLCVFLSSYATWLLGCGATCIRLEKNVGRIAAAFNKRADITIMPRHIHLTITDNCLDERFTSTATVMNSAIDFDMNARLSRLSWKIADSPISLTDACKLFSKIIVPSYQSAWAVLLLASSANASFCRLFGGDAVAMAVVFLATFAGYLLKQTLLARKLDVRGVFVLCAFVSSVIGSTDMLFSFGNTGPVALGTSVLYLVPGIPFLNSFSDMLYRHYICAFCRFVDALVLTCCLSIGLCAGMMLMNIGMF